MPKRSSTLLLPSPERLRRGEPLWRRVVFGRMVRGQTIAIGLAGAFGAMMLGLTLGNSALSQINPIYFQGAAIHPRDRGAAIDPNRPTVIPNSYEQLYGWSQGAQARMTACPDCTFDRPAVPAEVRTASAAYFGSREETAQRETRERREIDSAYAQNVAEAERRSETMQRLARYTHYRVSDDEVVRDPPADRPARERPYYARNDVVLDDGPTDEGDGDQE